MHNSIMDEFRISCEMVKGYAIMIIGYAIINIYILTQRAKFMEHPNASEQSCVIRCMFG